MSKRKPALPKMNAVIYLAAGGEVGRGATLHDTLDEAIAADQEYIDKFVDGKYSKTWKRVELDGKTKYTENF